MKTLSVVAKLLHWTDRITNTAMLIDALRNFVNIPKNTVPTSMYLLQ